LSARARIYMPVTCSGKWGADGFVDVFVVIVKKSCELVL